LKGAIALLAVIRRARHERHRRVPPRRSRNAQAELRGRRRESARFRSRSGPGPVPVTAAMRSGSCHGSCRTDGVAEVSRRPGQREPAVTGEPTRFLHSPARHAGVEQLDYRVYPLADHVADKIMATFQRYGRPSPVDPIQGPRRPRGDRDRASVDAEPQRAALRSEAERRAIPYPARFLVPDRTSGREAIGPRPTARSCRSPAPGRSTRSRGAFADPVSTARRQADGIREPE